ncbi:MAG: MFS transporter [Desulfovibrio sp.]|nr:MFS transporter [Desulfovibrio sp.]
MASDKNKLHIICFALIAALCLIGDSMLYVVLPIHFQEAGLSSLWEVGVILAVNRIVRLPLNPLVARLYGRISERTGILAAIAIGVLTTASYGFMPGFAFWIAARCLWGVAWTLLRIGSLFCILRLSDSGNRGHYTGVYNGLYRLGSLVGMLFGGILADFAGVGFTALLFSLVSAASFIPALLFIPRGRFGGEQAVAPGFGADFRAVFSDLNACRLLLAGGAIALVVPGVLASTLSRLIAVHTGGGVELAGLFVGAASLGGFFQALRWSWEPWLAPLTGRLSDKRYGRPRMLFWVLCAAAVFLVLLAAPLPLALWFCVLPGMQALATALTTLSDAALADAAALSGKRNLLVFYAFIVDAGSALGPLAAYALIEFFGVDAAYIFAAALFFVLSLALRRRAAGGTVQ